ncbi:hypothetical protein SAY86_002639 [Trapa natans]|uniref:Uncharacterized protein n=1 Tax=Trapa natans TaxID=22666 RepID=A0AAN7LRC3_TRANT|nr:hypothetical protein SAY86_002639 [Trapa natans]
MSMDQDLLKSDHLPGGGLQAELSAGENYDSRQPDYDRDGFRTPVSDDHKIPVAKSCPPTPRKRQQPAAITHKRKLTQFFEDTRRGEMESFFEMAMMNKPGNKRRCTSDKKENQMNKEENGAGGREGGREGPLGLLKRVLDAAALSHIREI